MLRYVLLLSLFFSSAAFGETLPKLREIKATGGVEPAITITSEAPFTYTTHAMPTLLRQIIDIPNTDPGNLNEVPVNSGMIAKVTVHKKMIGNVPVARVIIHLQREADMQIFPDTKGGNSISAIFRKGQAVTPPAPTAEPIAAPVLPQKEKAVVHGIEVTSTGLAILTSAPVENFRAFTLTNPERLVIDIPDATSTAKSGPLAANRWGFSFLRTGTYQDKLRLVFDRDAGKLPQYQVRKGEKGLQILFSPSR